jgi:hypothetical protein
MTVSAFNVKVSALRPAAENPNSIPEAKFKLLVKAIERVGFLQPVLVRPAVEIGAYEIIDGHHRVRAAQELGMESVPAVLVEKMDDATAIAERIGMNQLRGELDLTAVGRHMAELSQLGWSLDDMTITGFSEAELGDLMRSVSQSVDAAMSMEMAPLPDDYEVPAGKVKPVMLEIPFTDADDYIRAKQGLAKVAGDGGDLGAALLGLLDAKELS